LCRYLAHRTICINGVVEQDQWGGTANIRRFSVTAGAERKADGVGAL
jgi:hypothetical protein